MTYLYVEPTEVNLQYLGKESGKYMVTAHFTNRSPVAGESIRLVPSPNPQVGIYVPGPNFGEYRFPLADVTWLEIRL